MFLGGFQWFLMKTRTNVSFDVHPFIYQNWCVPTVPSHSWHPFSCYISSWKHVHISLFFLSQRISQKKKLFQMNCFMWSSIVSIFPVTLTLIFSTFHRVFRKTRKCAYHYFGKYIQKDLKPVYRTNIKCWWAKHYVYYVHIVTIPNSIQRKFSDSSTKRKKDAKYITPGIILMSPFPLPGLCCLYIQSQHKLWFGTMVRGSGGSQIASMLNPRVKKRFPDFLGNELFLTHKKKTQPCFTLYFLSFIIAFIFFKLCYIICLYAPAFSRPLNNRSGIDFYL